MMTDSVDPSSANPETTSSPNDMQVDEKFTANRLSESLDNSAEEGPEDPDETEDDGTGDENINNLDTAHDFPATANPVDPHDPLEIKREQIRARDRQRRAELKAKKDAIREKDRQRRAAASAAKKLAQAKARDEAAKILQKEREEADRLNELRMKDDNQIRLLLEQEQMSQKLIEEENRRQAALQRRRIKDRAKREQLRALAADAKLKQPSENGSSDSRSMSVSPINASTTEMKDSRSSAYIQPVPLVTFAEVEDDDLPPLVSPTAVAKEVSTNDPTLPPLVPPTQNTASAFHQVSQNHPFHPQLQVSAPRISYVVPNGHLSQNNVPISQAARVIGAFAPQLQPQPQHQPLQPVSSKSTNQPAETQSYLCFICHLTLPNSSDRDQVISCVLCHYRFHTSCVDLTKVEFNSSTNQIICARHRCIQCQETSGLFLCLSCPRSYCQAHVGSRFTLFDSLPAHFRHTSFTPLPIHPGCFTNSFPSSPLAESLSATRPKGILQCNGMGVCHNCQNQEADERLWRERIASSRKLSLHHNNRQFQAHQVNEDSQQQINQALFSPILIVESARDERNTTKRPSNAHNGSSSKRVRARTAEHSEVEEPSKNSSATNSPTTTKGSDLYSEVSPIANSRPSSSSTTDNNKPAVAEVVEIEDDEDDLPPLISPP